MLTGACGRGGAWTAALTHQLADPVQVVQEVLHRLPLPGRENTRDSVPARGWAENRRTRVSFHLRVSREVKEQV